MSQSSWGGGRDDRWRSAGTRSGFPLKATSSGRSWEGVHINEFEERVSRPARTAA